MANNDKELTPAEARKIREKVAKQTKARNRSRARKVVTKKAKSQATGFADFIRSHGVIGLAVGLVLGSQVKVLVDQINISFISPLISILLPGTESLNNKSFIFGGQAFQYGAFISVLISFVAIALVVYFVFKALHLDKLDKKD